MGKSLARRLRLGSRFASGAAFALAATLSLMYSNCQRAPDSGSSLASSMPPVDPPLAASHPDAQSATAVPALATLRLGDRAQTASTLIEIFTPEDRSAEGWQAVISTVNSFIGGDAPTFGGPCDVNSSQAEHDCKDDASSYGVPATAASTSVREANRLQACEMVISYDFPLSEALSKLPTGTDVTAAPTDAGLVAVYQLFYPGSDPQPATLAALKGLDREAAANGETVRIRWGLQVLTVCESPGWQNL